MKKTTWVGLIILIVGIICLAVGLGNDGFRTVYWDHGFNVEGTGRNKERTAHFDHVKQLTVATSNQVTIRKGNVSKISVTYPSKTKVTQSGNKLTVQGSKHWKKAFTLFGFHTVEDNFGHTVITVPKDLKLDSLTCHIHEYNSDNLNGHVRINGISAKRLSFSGESNLSLNEIHVADELKISSMGHLSLSNSTFNDGSLHNDVGNINLRSNQFTRLAAETDAGHISFNTQNVSKRFSADSETGSINGRVKRNRRTQISVSTSVGHKSIFGRSVSHYGRQNIKNPVNYHFTTEVGHVKIQ
ncbi:MAG: DUF4097 domain-containing protein [Lentilactobacillus diolivorans]|jgi:hypothetical protein|nr:DUF4097 domain-containing protein [Lentilactobacillus diolivorans]RRG04094.1 MAG: hypothetical protein DUD34_04190 [Lactobacillus sp.]